MTFFHENFVWRMWQPLAPWWSIGSLEVRADRLIHGDTTDSRWPPSSQALALVSRAFIDSWRFGVRSKLREFLINEIRDVRIVCRPIIVQPPPNPTAHCVVFVRRKGSLVIICIHFPRQQHLLRIVHTHDALRFGFGFGQRGQKQTGENSNDGYHNQQFDEREAVTELVR